MANVSVGNTTGLYIGSGQSRVLTNAQQLLSLLSNNGGVTFALDPAYGNARVEAFSSNFSNANIATYLPTYTGLLGGTLTTASQPNVTAVGTLTSLTATGNITTSNYFIGNGAFLTGVTGGSGNYGNANVAAFLPTYTGNLVSLTGNVITTANVTGAYFLGNGSQLTGLGATYGNANVAAFLPTYTGAISSMTGNLTTTANVQGAFILGNGSQLTGIVANYSNVNVAAYLPTYTGNMISMTGNVITTANVSANYFIGNGSALRSITGANVTGTVANATYATTAGSSNTANTAGLAQFVTGNAQANITSVGTLASLTVTGNVTSSGNVSAVYFLGNGSQLTGLPATYSNTNVAAFLPTYTGNLVSLTGAVITSANITGAYFLGNGSQLTGITANYSNVNVAAFLPTYSGLLGGTLTTNAQPNITSVGTLSSLTVTGNVTPGGISTAGNIQAAGIGATGNIQATFFLGNGSQLTGIAANYSNVNVAAYLPTYSGLLGGTLTTASQPNITSVGTLTSITTSGNLSAVYANISATVFASNIVTLGSSGNITGADYITANFFVGNGSLLTGISGAGTYGNANVAAFLPTYSGNLGGNLTTAAQTNITQVGNLTTANVTGSVLAFGNIGNQYFIGHSINSTFANTATYSDVKIAGWQYSSPTGTNVAAAAMSLTGNIQLTRTNDNNNARVRPIVITGLFDANGFSSSIGISPFSNSGSDTNLVVGISRMPAVVQQFNIVNSQATAVNISSAGGMVTTAGISVTNQRANVNYMVGQTVEVGLFANDTTSRIINATAYRADFATLTSNTANVGNRIAFECVDSTANIKIAGNIVSTAANIVANGATINGRATITGNAAMGGVTALTGYTETVTSASYTSGNVFSPNVQGATIQTLTLTQDTTINQFTNALAGQSCQLILTQDGTGSRLLTSNMKFAGGSKTLSTTAGAIDIISVLYDGTTYFARLTTGYA